MPLRDIVDRRVVERAVVADLDDAMLQRRLARPARQRLHVLAQHHRRAAFLVYEILDWPARYQLIVDVEIAVPHLDVVARQPDDALDVIGRGIARQFEDGNIAALRPVREWQVHPA